MGVSVLRHFGIRNRIAVSHLEVLARNGTYADIFVHRNDSSGGERGEKSAVTLGTMFRNNHTLKSERMSNGSVHTNEHRRVIEQNDGANEGARSTGPTPDRWNNLQQDQN